LIVKIFNALGESAEWTTVQILDILLLLDFDSKELAELVIE
jgi:hypothetical protein